MKEHPILFSAPMVRALLDGTKTQTRRVLKVEPPPGAERVIRPFHDERLHWEATDPHDMEQGQLVLGEAPRCPYGQPGDRLWVRETWYFEGTDMMRHGRTHSTQDGVVRYLADGARRTINTHWEAVERWMTRKPQNRPGIHMPRWASRITLEVTAVRVERLQDISEADAIAEGVSPDAGGRLDDDGAGFHRIGPVRGDSFPIARYALLWESINGPGSWAANPWVWVVSFKRVMP